MKNIQIPRFFFFASVLLLYSSMLSAQVMGIKLIEENKEKKYALLRTDASDNYATILRDTLNEFNRYPSAKAVDQYIPSLSDIQNFERVLKKSFVSNGEIVVSGSGEMLLKRFTRFNRQYSGYIDKAGDTILVVCFLDFNDRKKAKKFFSNWKYQNEYLASGLFLDNKPPYIYCFAYNMHLRVLTKFTV